MSQRFVVEKRPKGLIFQIQPDDSLKLRKLFEPSVSKRKQIHSRRFKDEYDSRYRPENFDFKNIQQKNVFIDSYYPKLLGDFSEDNKSYSSRDTPNWLEDTSETDSSTFGTEKNAYNLKIISERASLHNSSRSRLTLNCKTYTLISLSSDLESFTSKNNTPSHKITKSSSCCLYESRKCTEDEIGKEEVGELPGFVIEGCEAQSTTDCFAHLYKRIEALEEQLQETINKSLQQKEKEILKTMQKQQQINKVATSNLKNHFPKTPTDTSIGDEPFQQAEKSDNSDTEVEIQNIKKRLNALEKKLRDAKSFQTESSAPSNDLTTNGHVKKCVISGRRGSQTTVVLPNQVYFISPEPECKLDKTIRNSERVKKKAKCKRIKRKISTILSSRRRMRKSKNPSQTTVSTSCFALNEFDSIANSDEEAILTCKLIEKANKKRKKKQKNLCKKSSITNIRLGAPEGPKIRTEGGAPCSCWMTFSARYPDKSRQISALKNTSQPKPDEISEESKKQTSLVDLIDILKSGGKIRIPVLFEEVCKKSGTKTPGRNFSDISMRFVLVQENPKYPVKKFIKELTRRTNEKVENYLFGVSKCTCNNQVFNSETKKMKKEAEQWESELPKGLSPLNLTILALVLLLVGHYWRKRNFYKLAAMIDGPKPLPLIGNAMEYLALDHVKILDYLLEITTKYNGLAKVWLGGLLLVHISNPEDMEILLSSHKLIEKNRMYRFFDDVLGQGLLNARGDVWKKHRKIIAPTFHPSILKHFVKIFSEQSKILVKVLEKNADGRIFNVFPYVRNCALDFITETALENHIGAQLRVVAPATRAAERLMNITYNRMFKLWLYSDFIFYRTQQGKEYLRLRDLVKESTEPLLEVKKKEVAEQDINRNNTEGIKRKSFFRQLVELNENAENFTDKELRDEVVTMIITGYETTAATVGFILVMLGIHQEIQSKVYEEVVAMQEFLKGRELEAEDLTRFEYMDRVIKETLRLYPVGPIIFRECTSDVKLTTCTIPKGASVAVVILKTHRDPAIWENPDKFDPDHFLPEKCEKRHPYAYIPFSAGPRNCIGKQYAYLSMRVMLYHILSNYKVLCDLRNEDIKIKSEVTMKMAGGFKIRLLPRQKVKTN